MARDISGNSFDRNKYILQPIKGGSGCESIAEMKVRYGVVTEDELGAANGILVYDGNGKIAQDKFPSNFAVRPFATITGQKTIDVGASSVYVLTNFEVNRPYNVSFTGGTATISGTNITIRSNNGPGEHILKINSDEYAITVAEIKPDAPFITVNAIRADLGARLSIIGSQYVSARNFEHVETDWQVSLEPDFSVLIGGAEGDQVNLTALTLTVAGGGVYYIRARYIDERGQQSDWSNVVEKDQSLLTYNIANPTVIAVVNDGYIASKLYAKGSTFESASGSAHMATSWQVATDAEFSNLVSESLFDQAQLIEYSARVDNFSFEKLYFRCKYHTDYASDSGWSSPAVVNSNEITTDIPCVETQTIASGMANTKVFGVSVNISGDGNYIYSVAEVAGSSYLVEISRSNGIYSVKSSRQIGGALAPSKLDIVSSHDGSIVAVANLTVGAVSTVHVFKRNQSTGSLETYQSIAAPSGAINTLFGAGLAMTPDGSNIIIGEPILKRAHCYTNGGTSYTSKHIFTPDAGTYTSSAGANSSNSISYGYAVAITPDASTVVIGAPDCAYGTYTTTTTGRIYVYKSSASPAYVTHTYLDSAMYINTGLPIAFGTSLSLSNDGTIIVTGGESYTTDAAKLSYGYAQVNEIDSTGTYGVVNVLRDKNPQPYDYLGYTVKLSSDADHIYVDKHGSNLSRGEILVYGRSASGWEFMRAVAPSAQKAAQYFGRVFALSADESILVCGNATDGTSTNLSNVVTFEQPKARYKATQQIMATDIGANATIGYGVAISPDDRYIAVSSDPNPTYGKGKTVRVFKKGIDGWEITANITYPGATATPSFGSKMTFSGDGSVLAIAATTETPGYVYVYRMNDDTWLYETKVTNASAVAGFGNSVALSYDGSVLMVGNSSGNSGKGAIHIYTYISKVWTAGTSFTYASSNSLGDSLAINRDGTYLVATSLSNGAIYFLKRESVSTWTLLATNTIEFTAAGRYNAAMSEDGSRAVVGPIYKNGSGWIYHYTRSGDVWTLANEVSFGEYSETYAPLSLSRDGTKLVVLTMADASGVRRMKYYELVDGVFTLKYNRITLINGQTSSAAMEKIVCSATGRYVIVSTPHARDMYGAISIYA